MLSLAKDVRSPWLDCCILPWRKVIQMKQSISVSFGKSVCIDAFGIIFTCPILLHEPFYSHQLNCNGCLYNIAIRLIISGTWSMEYFIFNAQLTYCFVKKHIKFCPGKKWRYLFQCNIVFFCQCVCAVQFHPFVIFTFKHGLRYD